MTYFGLVGASGFGREVMPLTKHQRFFSDNEIKTVFVDVSVQRQHVGEYELMEEKAFLSLESKEKYFNVAIADQAIRRRVVEKYRAANCIPMSLIADNAVILDRVSIGEGAIICSFAHLTPDTIIGDYFHCNFYSYVAHDCRIGNFVTFAPRICCNGNVVVEDNVYIGTGAIIRQGEGDKPIVIGEGAVVGMGAVVTKSVPAKTVVLGNPAKPLKSI